MRSGPAPALHPSEALPRGVGGVAGFVSVSIIKRDEVYVLILTSGPRDVLGRVSSSGACVRHKRSRGEELRNYIMERQRSF